MLMKQDFGSVTSWMYWGKERRKNTSKMPQMAKKKHLTYTKIKEEYVDYIIESFGSV